MDEQHDSQAPFYISVIAVLPDNERQFFSINPEITVADFIDILENNGFISNLEQNKFNIICSGKILQDDEKFSSFSNSDYILIYILLKKLANANPLPENSYADDSNYITENLSDDQINNDDLQIVNFQNIGNFGNCAFFQRLFNYRFFLFEYQRPMNDEDPILEENNNNNNNDEQPNPRLISILNVAINFIYFLIGLFLGYRALFILIFIFLFSTPKTSIIYSILEGALVRISWQLISHFIILNNFH